MFLWSRRMKRSVVWDLSSIQKDTHHCILKTIGLSDCKAMLRYWTFLERERRKHEICDLFLLFFPSSFLRLLVSRAFASLEEMEWIFTTRTIEWKSIPDPNLLRNGPSWGFAKRLSLDDDLTLDDCVPLQKPLVKRWVLHIQRVELIVDWLPSWSESLGELMLMRREERKDRREKSWEEKTRDAPKFIGVRVKARSDFGCKGIFSPYHTTSKFRIGSDSTVRFEFRSKQQRRKQSQLISTRASAWFDRQQSEAQRGQANQRSSASTILSLS